ncbi:UDP-2,4-diacetamido-2,4,6-trideoxy-beta-L-altropyranose hydrolase [Leptothoe kymatousa]|uniref:UDP-2,4-diacetamido-2,4, 6-trideoxy-beta-L-altropyranose hydrolase n=1 Tax=Leptothoe kymatousa TAU-MAC 1615 TaxID=2364775 RepID=A0ABS5Y0P0_9CYAN|nr:UDP-2,4-diacetamido-2,4,6-trideoxy-beta-L-altropyranose hydrolase [Leptothoe kymatousa]MBT9311370.1 UDP-2,4-diacetamido-2,4,6-trideoxy-beta-L-altropyranose hydrolase [Leptothoe kymatousa TAU-MAC 1615]
MHVLIRVDASSKIGTGHVMRCIALAQILIEYEQSVTFLMSPTASVLESRLNAENLDFEYLSQTSNSQEDAEKTIGKAQELATTWIVIDGYHFDAEYQYSIQTSGFKLLLIDDYGQTNYYWADIVLNQNIYAHESLYINRKQKTHLLLGSSYVLLRKEFRSWQHWQRKTPKIARKILVTLGGSDPNNVTLKVIQSLTKLQVNTLEVIVVVGGSNPHYQQIAKFVKGSNLAISLRHNVRNMPELMAWADLAVTAGGSTCWELIFMGLPSIVIVLAQNQCAIAEQLDSRQTAINLGWDRELSLSNLESKIDELVHNPELRRELGNNTRNLIDGEGVYRTLMHLQNQRLRLRNIQKKDCSLIWQWANDPDVRNSSFSSKIIPWEEHVQWFNSKQQAITCVFYIALDKHDVPIGSIRFDISNNNAVISLSIQKEKRNQGYGTELIKLGTSQFWKNHSKINLVTAYIQINNQASLKAFIKAGFQETETTHYKNKLAIQLTKQYSQ